MRKLLTVLLLAALTTSLTAQINTLPTIDDPKDADRIDSYTRGFAAAYRLDTLAAYFYRYIADRRGAGGGGAVDTFNLNQPILRTLSPGEIVGGNSFSDWASWHYFAPPTISLSGSSSTHEVGTVSFITYTATTSNPGQATLSNGRIERNGSPVIGYGSATSGSLNYTFAPTAPQTQQFRARQDWGKGGESGTATSNTRTLRAVYPVLWGVSSTDLSQGGNAYTVLSEKRLTTEGNQSGLTMDGSGFIYIAVPSSWSRGISKIIDGNGFDVTGSFTEFTRTVSSTGLPNNYSHDYRLYKLNTPTNASNANYSFQR